MSENKLINKIASINWLQRWAGSFTFISCHYWGYQYHFSLKKILGVSFNNTLFIHKKGVASFYVSTNEFRKLGKYLANKSSKDAKFAKKYTNALKHNTDVLMPLMKKINGRIPSWQEYKKFLPVFEQHLAYHSFVKKTVDFLPQKDLARLLPSFKDARLYSEDIYTESEVFFRNIMKTVAKKEKYRSDYLTCLTQTEFEAYLKTQALPEEKDLKQRFESSALYFNGAKFHLLLGSNVNILEKKLLQATRSASRVLQGISGYRGKVKGTVRIVSDPFKVKKFNSGDILVTGMTRPEFLPLVQKSSAIITESGGILCHAAITARELKKPCIVGVPEITKILKDGDVVEVDADKGLIKIIKRT